MLAADTWGLGGSNLTALPAPTSVACKSACQKPRVVHTLAGKGHVSFHTTHLPTTVQPVGNVLRVPTKRGDLESHEVIFSQFL